VTLAEIKDTPPAKDWSEIKFDNTRVYRYCDFRCRAAGGQTWQRGVLQRRYAHRGGERDKGGEKGIRYQFFLPDAQDDRSALRSRRCRYGVAGFDPTDQWRAGRDPWM